MGVQHKMGHLACFIGGLFTLAAKDAPTETLKTWYTEVSIGHDKLPPLPPLNDYFIVVSEKCKTIQNRII